MKARVMGGIVKLEGAALAEQDQFEAEFEAAAKAGTEPWRSTLEVQLSKHQGATYSKPKMAAFLAVLARWAIARTEDGYTVSEAVEPGPGTMVWKATKA